MTPEDRLTKALELLALLEARVTLDTVFSAATALARERAIEAAKAWLNAPRLSGE